MNLRSLSLFVGAIFLALPSLACKSTGKKSDVKDELSDVDAVARYTIEQDLLSKYGKDVFLGAIEQWSFRVNHILFQNAGGVGVLFHFGYGETDSGKICQAPVAGPAWLLPRNATGQSLRIVVNKSLSPNQTDLMACLTHAIGNMMGLKNTSDGSIMNDPIPSYPAGTFSFVNINDPNAVLMDAIWHNPAGSRSLLQPSINFGSGCARLFVGTFQLSPVGDVLFTPDASSKSYALITSGAAIGLKNDAARGFHGILQSSGQPATGTEHEMLTACAYLPF